MHELSIVLGIVDIAMQQAAQTQATTIQEIVLDIGCLSTIEMNAFEFAWQQGVKNTMLEKATREINRIPGIGWCIDCEESFSLQHVFDPCPSCGQHLIRIMQGKELRVRSLVIQ